MSPLAQQRPPSMASVPGSASGSGSWLTTLATLVVAMAALAFAPRGVAAQWLVLVVLAPLLEEALFRAGLHEWLLRNGTRPWTANVLTAAVFGGAHALVRADPLALAVALPALVLGRVYGQTRRVRWCVALHAVMNGLWLLVHPWL